MVVWRFDGPQARAALLGYVRRSLQLTAPYCVARGLADPSAAFAAAESADVPPGLAGGLTSGAQRAAGRAETKLDPPPCAEPDRRGQDNYL